jgi:hypothetical protein
VNVKINEIELNKVITHYKTFARWMKNDIHDWLRISVPRWKIEFTCYQDMMRSGTTYMDIQKLDLFREADFETYRKFRETSGLFSHTDKEHEEGEK